MKHSEEAESTGSQSSPTSPGPVDTSRRRFTRAGLSASVIMTLASRPALATHCSVSGGMSGNASMPHQSACHGLTPGFWKTHPEEWSCGYEPGLCHPERKADGTCKNYDFITFGNLKQLFAEGKVTQANFDAYVAWANWNATTGDNEFPHPSVPPTTLAEAFAGSNLTFTDPNQTMMQALWDPPEVIEPQTLVAHLSAGLLNICRFGIDYGYADRDAFIQFIRDWAGSLEALKDEVEKLNVRGGS